MLSAAEPKTAVDLARDYAAVRARLWPSRNPKPAPRAIVAVAPKATLERPAAPPIATKLLRPQSLRFYELPRWPWLSNEPSPAKREKLPSSVRARMILQIVALDEGVTVDEIKGRMQAQEFVGPRDLAIHLVNKANPTWSTTVLGQFFGGRDHTTILHSLRKFRSELDGVKYVAKRYGKKTQASQ